MKRAQIKSQKQLQVLRKLKTIRTSAQLKTLLGNLENQKEKLVTDVKTLRDRVSVLLEKHRLKIDSKNLQEKPISMEIAKVKLELSAKYSQMKALKKKVHGGEQVDQNIVNSEVQRQNNLKSVETGIAQYRAHSQDLLKQKQFLQKSVQQIQKEMKSLNPKILELQRDNSDYRTKIFSLRRSSQQKLYQSVKVQDNLVKVRSHYRHNTKLSLADVKDLKTPNKTDIIRQEQDLKKQIGLLKTEIQSVESINLKRDLGGKRGKDRKAQQNKAVLARVQHLEIDKTRAELELNRYRILWRKICLAKETKQNKPVFQQTQTQAQQYQDQQPLRRDFGGVLGHNMIDDRQILKTDKNTFIRGMIAYENDKGLVAIKCLYSNGAQTQLPIPQPYLNRCKTIKLQIPQGDFIKVLKVKFNSVENRIVKMEALSNRNVKNQAGQKRPFSDLLSHQTVYGFDISVGEYPVCCFSSFVMIKNHWFLESFGTEINDLKED